MVQRQGDSGQGQDADTTRSLSGHTDDILSRLVRDGAPRPTEPDSPPARIGRFRILELLGQGGMGDVYLAFDEALSRKIALKRIRGDRLDQKAVRHRFEIEARVTAILQHPSVVPVYEYVTGGDDAFYTMRPIAGTTLSDLLRRIRRGGPRTREEWSTARLVRIFLQVAGAVAYAHSRGVIHRDLKPSNIMVGPFEEVLVLDWGMAKVIGQEVESDTTAPDPHGESLEKLTAETASRYLVGTPAYMAPEQLLNEPATYRSDVFALGVILYELLALRSPWSARSIPELGEAMRTPPELPTRIQPGRAIPHDLAVVALRALEYDPGRRFPDVAAFARQVAHALEGRASWTLEEETRRPTSWRFAGGKISHEESDLVLRSRGRGDPFRYFCAHRVTDNVRVQFEVSFRKGSHQLSVWLNTARPRDRVIEAGYNLLVLPGKRRTLSLWRSGRVVAGAKSPRYDANRTYRVSVARQDDRFSLTVDGEEIYVYHDPIPLTGGYVGITGQSNGVRLSHLRVYSRGASATVSCLAVPDAFYNRKLYEEARAEYDKIAVSHPGRDEGRLAGFRSGLCMLEMARQQTDSDLRAVLLSEAYDLFSRLASSSHSCLPALGLAMIAAERGDTAAKHEALARGLRQYPGDPHFSALQEWLLGRLHAVGAERRRTLAELLPLALTHCRDDWGRRVIRGLVQEVRNSWEIPSFMTSRGRFRENDPVSRAETTLYFAFWAGRPELIEQTLADLVHEHRLRPHHLADAVFSLLELGETDRAWEILRTVDRAAGRAVDTRMERIRDRSRCAVLSARGDLDGAEALLATTDPEPNDRVFNSARLWASRSALRAGDSDRAFKVLRRIGPTDSFSREQQAWLSLELGDPDRADSQLKPFLDRDDHRTGKNLSNFLHGVSLIMRGRRERAEFVFSSLDPVPWPRTWTLGSHYALGRLGQGDVRRYLDDCFPWERETLRQHAALLLRAEGKPPDALPAGLE